MDLLYENVINFIFEFILKIISNSLHNLKLTLNYHTFLPIKGRTNYVFFWTSQNQCNGGGDYSQATHFIRSTKALADKIKHAAHSEQGGAGTAVAHSENKIICQVPPSTENSNHNVH